ncbi:MAG: DMT family transporter [Bacteroidaceae bacterium]|nr:DMT family transporter [Bacteroidaceae bacterium]
MQIGCKNTKNFRQHHNPSPTILASTDPVALGEGFPLAKHIAILLLLGFVACGLSIYCYTYAQRTIGAARTSTYYALAPFIGAALSFVLIGEPLTPLFLVATAVMAAGCWLAAKSDGGT